MSLQRFPILQSGFVSRMEAGLQRPGDTRDPFRDYTLNQAHLSNNNVGFFLPEINLLMTEFRGNPEVINNPDWVIRLIRAAKEGFGNSLYEWVRNQDTKPTVGRHHVDFLEDMFHYVVTGERRITLNNWYRLIGLKVTSGNVGVREVSKLIHVAVDKDEWTPWGLVSSDIKKLLVQWMAHEHGIVDMLFSLFILFGQRSTVDTMEDKNR